MHLILPYWPRLYSRLANEQDRRVREATQKAHLVGKLYMNTKPEFKKKISNIQNQQKAGIQGFPPQSVKCISSILAP